MCVQRYKINVVVIFNASPGPEVIKLQLSIKFQMLIKTKMLKKKH